MDLSNFRRSLKLALKFYNQRWWTESLPIVSPSLRSTFKEDAGGTCYEILYETTLTLRADFLQHYDSKEVSYTDSTTFFQQLCDIMRKLSPIPTSGKSETFYFKHSFVETYTYAFCKTTQSKHHWYSRV